MNFELDKTIEIYSRKKFEEIFQEEQHNKDNCFIGIISSNERFGEHPLNNRSDLVKFLISFNDIDNINTNDDYYLKMFPFSEDDAKYTIKFITSVPVTIKHYIIQCDAGISRSGAIGLFISKYLDYKQMIIRTEWDESEKALKECFENLKVSESYYIQFLKKYAFNKVPNTLVTYLLEKEFQKQYNIDFSKIFC